jgi:hypothetical protein
MNSKTVNMKKYFVLDLSADGKVIGAEYPQLEEAKADVRDGLWELAYAKGKRLKSVSPISNLKLGKRNKLTDVLSCSLGAGGDFVISSKVFEILKDFNTQSLQIIPTTILHKGANLGNFYWIHFTYAFEKFIDFANCTYDMKMLSDTGFTAPESYEEYNEAISSDLGKYNWLRMTRTVLGESFPANEDIFMLCRANQRVYVSVDLMSAFHQKKITGCDFKEASDLFFKSQ